MTDRSDDDPPTSGFLREIEVFHDAEDVKRVWFHGDQGTVEVQVTDESMVEFLETAENVFDRIHEDMAEMRDIFNDACDRAADDSDSF